MIHTGSILKFETRNYKQSLNSKFEFFKQGFFGNFIYFAYLWD